MLDRLAVGPLAEGLGLDRLALARDADHILRQRADLGLLAVVHELQDVADGLAVDALALGGQGEQAVDRLFRQIDVFRLPADAQLAVPVRDRDAEGVLDQADVLVKGAEHADDVLDPVYRDDAFCHFFRSFAMFSLHRARRHTVRRPSAAVVL